MKISMNKALVNSYLFIVILAGVMAVCSIAVINSMQWAGEELHERKYTTVEGLQRVDANLVRIHHTMLDALLTSSDLNRRIGFKFVQQYENLINSQIDSIALHYNGDVEKVFMIKRAFSNWEPIRNEVIALSEEEQFGEAVMFLRGTGGEYFANLDRLLTQAIEESQTDRELFYGKFLKNQNIKNITLWGSSLIVAVILAIGLYSVNYVNKSVQKVTKTVVEYEKTITEGEVKALTQDPHINPIFGPLLNGIDRTFQRIRSTMLHQDTSSRLEEAMDMSKKLPASIIVLDGNGKFISVNSGIEKMLGGVDEQRCLRILEDSMFGNSLKELFAEAVIKKETAIRECVERNERGESVTLRVTCSPNINNYGRCDYAYGIVSNITSHTSSTKEHSMDTFLEEIILQKEIMELNSVIEVESHEEGTYISDRRERKDTPENT